MKRKYNRGHHVKGQWVVNVVERGSGKTFLVAVHDRTTDTLISSIHPGTTIISDCWASYSTVSEEGYQHKTVNHSITFVDPVIGAHTNTVDSTWRHVQASLAKWLHTVSCGIHTLSCGIHTLSCGIHTVSCGIHTVSCGIHAVSCGIHVPAKMQSYECRAVHKVYGDRQRQIWKKVRWRNERKIHHVSFHLHTSRKHGNIFLPCPHSTSPFSPDVTWPLRENSVVVCSKNEVVEGQ